MAATVQDLILVLQTYFPGNLPLTRVIYALLLISGFYPLLRLHQNQAARRNIAESGWMGRLKELLQVALYPEVHDTEGWIDEGPEPNIAQEIYEDLPEIINMLDLDKLRAFILERRHMRLLCTTRLMCNQCPNETESTLRSRDKMQSVKLITENFKVEDAYLLVAHCPRCKSNYYPDKVTLVSGDENRIQTL